MKSQPNPLYDTLFKAHENSDAPLFHNLGINYRQFLERAGQYASLMSAMGLIKGDRVAVQVEKSWQAIAVYAACVKAGLVFLPLNTGYTAHEISFFLEDSGAKLLLVDESRLEAMEPIAGQVGAEIRTLNADGTGSFTQASQDLSSNFATVGMHGDELAALLYTSGTTGRSKGAMLSQDNLISNAQALKSAWRFNSDDTLIHALPIFHTHGLFVALNLTFLCGSKLHWLPKFDEAQIIDAFQHTSCLMGVPTFYTRLLSHPDFSATKIKNMRLFISGSAPLLADTHKQFEDKTGHRILERYGMTETNMNTSNPYDGDRRAGTVGFPLDGVEVRVCNESSVVTNGEIGILEVRGPNVFKGYWNLAEKTAEELKPDGWFITGDLASISEDGYVTIVGRGKDLIISGGLNIYPKEVETLLDQQPDVIESAVIGVPHPDFGESPIAILVSAPGQAPDLEAIKSEVNQKLARFKHPRHYVVTDSLPRNTMGKVQKNLLRETYAGLFA